MVRLNTIIFALILIFAVGCKPQKPHSSSLDNQQFLNPPKSAKPHTWWHWMNGHVTRESITLDLEAMNEAGLGGFTLFNSHEGIPKGPVKYANKEWWNLLDHTISEADRLGLEMVIFNGAGWSTTGAAFVTPEMAMQEVAWTESTVTGPGKVSLKLRVPQAALGIDRDMKRDPEINKRYYVAREQVEGHFRDLAIFAVPAIPADQEPWYLEDWRNKTGFGKMSAHFHSDDRRAPPEQVINLDQVLDISRYKNDDGMLNWEAPPGNWTILRMGYQPTARSNHPASHGGKGLEIDKMSSEAMDLYWKNFLDKVVQTAGERVGQTFQGILIDSYEAGHQNWTHNFHQDFIDAQGYDFRKFLPVVTGRILENVEFTERILWDYRKVISDLIVEEYYGRMADLTGEAGVKFVAEPYGTYGNTNDFDVAGKVDIPACEWWAYRGSTDRIGEAKLVASAAHTYGRTVVGSEAFTGMPDRIFETYPGAIKSQGDFFMAHGVNRFTFHTWAHDPYEIGPGLGLGTYGSRFDNRNTWWPFASAWLEYLSRCQYILQQGEFIGDVLYFVGEDAPLRSARFHKEQMLKTLPDGYDYAFCNREILHQLTLNENFLKTKRGSSFRLLVLPESSWMSIEVLQKIEALVASGAIVSGPKPVSPPGRISEEDKSAFSKLVKQIWGNCDGTRFTSNQHGKGNVYWGEPLGKVLVTHGVKPDFSFIHKEKGAYGSTLYPGNGIEFIHRRIGSDEVYFLSNQHAKEKTIVAKFRVNGKTPEVWYPDNGKICMLQDIQIADTYTEVTLHFETEEAYFVVFRDPGQSAAHETVPWLKSAEFVKDLSEGWTVDFNLAENPITRQMPELVSWTDLKDDNLKYHSGTATYKTTFFLNDGISTEASYHLDLGIVQVISEVVLNGQNCGIAWKNPYRVDVSDAIRAGQNTIEITVANLWVNRIVGDQQYPDDVEWTDNTGSTAKGQGLQYIPDWVKHKTDRPVSQRKTFYAWKWSHITADKELLSSGLLGPVKLIYITH